MDVRETEYRGWTLTWIRSDPKHRWIGIMQKPGWPDLKYDRMESERAIVAAMKRDVDRLEAVEGQPVP